MKATLAILWDNYHCDVKAFIMFIMVSSVTWNTSVSLMRHLTHKRQLPPLLSHMRCLLLKAPFPQKYVSHTSDFTRRRQGRFNELMVGKYVPTLDRNLQPDDVSVDCVHINKSVAPYSVPTCPWIFVKNSEGSVH